jgi:nicotinate-nucleotide adenylyltransferase
LLDGPAASASARGPSRFGDKRRMRIGVLGGSFNPAHAGHRHIAEFAQKRLALDEIWLLVSPGNPLKPVAGMAPFAERLASARGIGDRRILATPIEAEWRTRYTVDTLAMLKRRFPRACFVWLMGADNLAQLARWRRWTDIARMMPFAVLPRPTYNHRALAGQAAQRLRRYRCDPRRAASLCGMRAPAWIFLPVPQHPASATAIRMRRMQARRAAEGAVS